MPQVFRALRNPTMSIYQRFQLNIIFVSGIIHSLSFPLLLFSFCRAGLCRFQSVIPTLILQITSARSSRRPFLPALLVNHDDVQ